MLKKIILGSLMVNMLVVTTSYATSSCSLAQYEAANESCVNSNGSCSYATSCTQTGGVIETITCSGAALIIRDPRNSEGSLLVCTSTAHDISEQYGNQVSENPIEFEERSRDEADSDVDLDTCEAANKFFQK